MTILIHPHTNEMLNSYRERPAQAIILTGKRGVGLHTVALWLSRTFNSLSVVEPKLLTKTSTITQIGVEQIRDLYVQTRSKQSKISVVVIDDADKMTISAQNAFLKLLEEPPDKIRFILTAHEPNVLLPTISSRLQSIHIRPIEASQTETLLQTFTHIDDIKKNQLRFLAQNLPAELMRLSTDDKYFKIRSERIRLCRELIESPAYRRLILLKKTELKRDQAIAVVYEMIEMLSRAPQTASISRMQKLLVALSRIEHGGNIRLQLARGVV